MSSRSVRLLLEDIVVAIEKISRYTAGTEIDGFLADELTQDAVIRNLEIIGEAVRRIPEDFRRLYPQIPWWQIAAMRNRIVHDYLGVDLEIVWNVVQNDALRLEMDIREILEGLAE